MDGNSQVQSVDMEFPRFQFPGFVSTGTCFVRARVRHDGLVILCAQLYGYKGTSVTNAVEEVREAVIARLHDDTGLRHLMPAKKWWQRERTRDEVLDHAAAHTTWIEHYPKGCGLAAGATFAVVEFDDAGTPEWYYKPLATVAQHAAVEEEFLTVDPQRLHFP